MRLAKCNFKLASKLILVPGIRITVATCALERLQRHDAMNVDLETPAIHLKLCETVKKTFRRVSTSIKGFLRRNN